jgi:uncharacterized protein (DUF342 family)
MEDGREMNARAEIRAIKEGSDQSPPADRITVALIPKAAEDLQRLQDRTGLSKTDLANRAISVYEFVESQAQAGRDLYVRDRETGEYQLIRFL